MENAHAILHTPVCGCQNSENYHIITPMFSKYDHRYYMASPPRRPQYKLLQCRCYPRNAAYLASATSCLSKRAALTFQGNLWL
jgi:hypothetical protein